MAETRISGATEPVVVFDLDDTLFDEVDFILSGIKAVKVLFETIEGLDVEECCLAMREAVRRHKNHYSALEHCLDRAGVREQVDMSRIVTALRSHCPVGLELRPGVRQILDRLYRRGVTLGILTDGRSVTQRHKIAALGIEHYFDSAAIRISGETGIDKSNPEAYRWFSEHYPGRKYVYVGDNPAKDFVWPNRMGWLTICISDYGRNIHSQQGIWPGELCALMTVYDFWEVEESIYKNDTNTEE